MSKFSNIFGPQKMSIYEIDLQTNAVVSLSQWWANLLEVCRSYDRLISNLYRSFGIFAGHLYGILTSIQWTRTGPNAPKVVFEYFRSLYDLLFKSSSPYKLKSGKTAILGYFGRFDHFRWGCFWPKWSKGTSTDQDLSFGHITKSLWPSVQKF